MSSIKVIHCSSENCGVCVSLRPKLEQLSKRLEIEYEEIDVTVSNREAMSYRVMSAPTILLLVEGKEYSRDNGYISLGQFEDKILRIKSLINE